MAASSSSAAKAGGKTAGDCQAFIEAVRSFLNDHSSFESSVPFELMMTDIKKLSTPGDIFLTPLREKMINFESALKWAFFLSLMIPKMREEADLGVAALDTRGAFESIARVYDLAANDNVWDHIKVDESDESAEEEEEEEGSSEL